MIEGADKRRRELVLGAQADERLRRADDLTLVRNPNYDPATDSKAAARALPDSFVFIVNTNADDIYNKIEAGELEDDEARRSRRKSIREYATELEPEAATALQLGRPHVVHHDEPDPAAVRRHPRPQGDELDHGQGRPAQGVGRPDRRQIANHIVPDTLFNNLLDELRPVQDAGRPRQRREGDGRR